MKDIERHLDANCGEPAIEAAEALLDEAGVKIVYYAVVSVNGRLLTKLVPRKHFRRNIERGVQFHASAIADLTTTLSGDLLGGGAQAHELTAMPDPSTAVVLPWDRDFAFVFCNLFVRPDDPDEGGAESVFDVRGLLRSRHDSFHTATGLRLRSGCEPEMSWISESEPFMRPGLAPNYHLGTLDDNRNLVKQVIAYASSMGLDMIEGDYEDKHQIELNWMYDDAEKTADRLVLYRLLCRQVGREFGVIASFMPKPFEGIMGNGCHHNVSLWDRESNAFLDPATSELHVSQCALWAIGGLLQYSAAGMAVMAPTVNSYKRFADVGQFAPVKVNWGMDNKTCTVRVPASGRLEYKVPDASVNPYFSHAVILEMMQRGLEEKIDPGAPADDDSVHGAESSFPALSRTLGESITTALASDLLESALGQGMARLFADYKLDEWQRSCATVTEWDRAHYLEFLP